MSDSNSPRKTMTIRSTSLLAAAIALSLGTSSLTGCKMASFSKPKLPNFMTFSKPEFKKPDLSRMAFWKTENLVRSAKGKMPQPPSRSFDPSPLDEALAASSNAASERVSELSNGLAENVDKLKKPLRKPYGSDTKVAVEKLAGKDGFNFDATAAKAKLPDFGAKNVKIAKAQQDFQAALASSTKAIEKSVGGKLEDVKSRTSDFAGDFSAPAAIKKAKANADNSLFAVNKSLYDSAGNLASNTKKKAANAFGGGSAAVKNSVSLFEERLKSAASKSTVASTAKPQTLAAVDETKSEVAQLKAQLADLKAEQQKMLELTKKQMAQFAGNTPASSSPSSSNAFSGQPAARPAATQANALAPQMYPSTAPLRTASSNNNVLSSAPGNVLRGNFSPIRTGASPSTGGQTLAPQPSQPSNNGYPSTPHNSYTPQNGVSANTSTGSTANSQVSFQQSPGSNLVINASTPVDNSGAENYVSDVNIPDSVLRGSSSYAPGSVQPLRR